MRSRSILLATLSLAPQIASAQDVGTVALVLGQRGSGFHQAIACGARAAAEEFGAEVEIQAAANYAATEQIPLLNSVLATGPAAIVLDPTSSTSLVAPLADAAAQGVTIVAVDTTVDDPSMLTAEVATDNFQVGVETAKALVELLDGRTDQLYPGHLDGRRQYRRLRSRDRQSPRVDLHRQPVRQRGRRAGAAGL